MAVIEPTPFEPLSIGVVPDRSEVAVVLAGELDVSCIDQLEHEVRELRDVGFDQIVVDLRRVRFIDSSALRLLLSLRNDAKRAGHAFTLIPGPPEVRRLFELTGTRGLFDWRDH